jgi:hypothetical protein
VLGTSIRNGKVPADAPIQIAFDRYLLPSTVTRQSIGLFEASGMPVAPEVAIVTYDPIARTATLRPMTKPWLKEGQFYKIVLGIPEGDSDTGGVRAIDRATLYREQQLEFAFSVDRPASLESFEPSVTLCRDVLPIFAAKCSNPTCHGTGDSAAAGLILDTSAGIAATALNRIAQGSNTGGRSGLAPEPGRQFGVDMPIVQPGKPGNSWLMYKIELARPPAIIPEKLEFGCTMGLKESQTQFVFEPLVPQAQRTADEIERSILSNFILGREMPFPVVSAVSYYDSPLTFDERQKVRIWIETGARVPECGGCGEITPTDGGSSEAGSFDSGATDSGAGDSGDASDAADAGDSG